MPASSRQYQPFWERLYVLCCVPAVLTCRYHLPLDRDGRLDTFLAEELHEEVIDPGSAGLLFSWSRYALVIGLGAFGETSCHFSNRVYFFSHNYLM